MILTIERLEVYKQICTVISLLILLTILPFCSSKDAQITKKKTKFLQASEAGDLQCIKRLINSGVSIDEKNVNGQTPLYLAVRKGHAEIVEFLLSKGADPNSKDSWGDTPLHVAVTRVNREGVVSLLLARGANPNLKNKDGQTPLHYAAYFSETTHATLMSILLESGADPNIPDQYGKSPLHYAATSPGLAKILLDKGAYVNAQDNEGDTPLFFAVLHWESYRRYQGIEPLIVLLSYGADQKLKNTDGKSALDWARERKYNEVVEFFGKNK